MPRIDPKQLLRTLGVLLSPEGGIKSAEEVVRLVQLMSKFSRKLVSKCIYVQILHATPAGLLGEFLDQGGWPLLNSWFDDAIKSQNWPLCREMLDLFDYCPISPELLKDGHQAPRLINQLRQEASIEQDIRKKATDIYDRWVDIVSPSKRPRQAESGRGTPITLLQSLAAEVSESIRKTDSAKENEAVCDAADDDDDDDDEEDEEILAMRKVPPVMKPRTNIIDASIKSAVNKAKKAKALLSKAGKAAPNAEKASKADKDAPKADDEASKADKDVAKADKETSKADKEKADKRSRDHPSRKRFRPDHRDEVNPEEKQRIKDMARRLKEEAQAKKDKETLSKAGMSSSMSSLGRIPKIPKKPTNPDEKKSKATSFADMLGGLDAKPKTVRTPHVKNKTAAMLEGMTKSASASSLPTSQAKNGSAEKARSHHRSGSNSDHKHHHHSHSRSSRNSVDKSLSDSSSKKPPSDGNKKSPSDSKKSPAGLSLPSTPESSTAKRRESDSPKLKSPHNFHESTSFMDAIFSSMNKDEPRKKKRRLSDAKDEPVAKKKTDKKEDPVVEPKPEEESASEEKKQQAATATFSFYRDTLDTPPAADDETKLEDPKKEAVEDDKIDEDSGQVHSDSSPREETKNGHDDSLKADEPEEEAMEFDEPTDPMPREVKGILVYHRGHKSRHDRRIKWKPEADLVSIQYFELDEDERVNVNKLKFENMREFESKMEKAALKNKSSEVDEVQLAWYKPVRLLVDNREPFEPGEKSREKETQTNREKSVLQVIYFSREMTPDTPAEAEASDYAPSTVTAIPLDDEAGGDEDSNNDYAKGGWPEPKVNEVSKNASIESQFSLPPALSSLLSTINASGLSSILPPAQSLSKEEQDTLAAQTQAMKAMGILPGIDIAPSFPPPVAVSEQQAAYAAGPPVPPPFGPQRPNMAGGGYPPVPPPFGGYRPRGHGGRYPMPPPHHGRGGYRTGGPMGMPPRGMPPIRHPHYRDHSRMGGPKPCKFFLSKGSCREGDSCRFLHLQQPPGPRV